MGCDMKTPAYRKKKVQEMLDYLSEIGLSVCGPVFKDGVEHPAFMDYDADEIISRRKHIQDGTIEYSDDWLWANVEGEWFRLTGLYSVVLCSHSALYLALWLWLYFIGMVCDALTKTAGQD